VAQVTTQWGPLIGSTGDRNAVYRAVGSFAARLNEDSFDCIDERASRQSPVDLVSVAESEFVLGACQTGFGQVSLRRYSVGHGSPESRVCSWVPVIQGVPDTVGTIAGRSPTDVDADTVPTNVESMIDRITSWSPTPSRPCATRTASRADTPVPVGDRSSFPGSITVVLRIMASPSTICRGPVILQNEM
jgi:hypothetical protein